MTEDFKEIRIPSSLQKRLNDHLPGSPFDTIEDFVAHLLRRGLVEESSGESILTEDEETTIKQRLRDLGYLD
jgi:hypothetical protein